MKIPLIILSAGCFGVANAGLANPRGIWSLDTNFAGVSSDYPTMNSASLTLNTDYVFSSDTDGYSFLQVNPFIPKTKMLKVTNSTGVNGGPGATRTNCWSVAMDVKFDNLQPFATILQLDPTNNTDGTFYTSSSNNLTASVSSTLGPLTQSTAVAINTWQRIVITCGNDGDGGPLSVRCYINGVLAGSPVAGPFNGNFAMQPTFNLFSDDNGDLKPLKLGSMGFWGEALSPSDIAAMGAPRFSGIPDTAKSLSWTNFAGMPGGAGSSNGTGAGARLNYPTAIASTSGGTLYVSDSNNYMVREVTGAGVTTTVAGSSGYQGVTDGVGSAARFEFPAGLCVDSAGTLFVADQQGHTIRKITSDGTVSTLAGTPGSGGYQSGMGTAAKFSLPSGVTTDGSGNLYVADYGNHVIRRVGISSPSVVLLAGSAGISGSSDGSSANARFNNPSALTMLSGFIYVADEGSHTIRRVTSTGSTTTIAGNAGVSGSTDGLGTAAKFYSPSGIAADSLGNLYVADTYNHKIRKINTAEVVSTYAGDGVSGNINGGRLSARFNRPSGISVDGAGNVYVTELGSHDVRKIDTSGNVTTLIGKAPAAGGGDGAGSLATFSQPKGMVIDPSGNLIVADSNSYTIRKISPTGAVTTIAGAAGLSFKQDGVGTAARFTLPSDVALDAAGNIYVADYYYVRKITPSGVVSTIAGSNAYGTMDGTGTAARFAVARGIAINSSGDLIVSENGSGRIRLVTLGGVVTTIPGVATSGASGVVVNATGEIFVASTTNNQIVRISGGALSVFAGDSAGSPGRVDGSGTSARFNAPSGLEIDASGNLYVTEEKGHTVRKITSTGIVTTLGGSPGTGNDPDGVGGLARFSAPAGIAISPTGVLFVGDSDNNRISRANTPSALTTLETWRQFYFGTTANTGSAAGTADFDKDGVPNLAEYAFGTDPTKPGSRPQQEIVRTTNNLIAQITPPSGLGGITFGAESSATLAAGSWSIISPVTQNGTYSYVVPISGQSKRFIRFSVKTP